MGHSQRLRLSDARSIIRLIHELCELGYDGNAWRMHMLERLRQLVGAQVALCYIHDLHIRPNELQLRAYREIGADPLFHEYVQRADMNDDATTPAIIRLVGTSFTRSRDQLCSDEEWYNSVHFNEVRRPVRSDHLLASQVPLPQLGAFSHLGFGRLLGDPPFGRRDREVIHLFHTELAELWRTPLRRNGGASEQDLTPRLRQTLALLAEGLAEKEIAARLGLSVHTVHDYVKALHRQFNAHSSTELLARVVTARQFRPRLDDA